MIVSFRDKGTEAIFDGDNTKAARRVLPQKLHSKARIKLEVLNASVSLEGLGRVPANRLEKLSGNRQGQYSVRINEQYRLCFQWTDVGAGDVHITDYHD